MDRKNLAKVANERKLIVRITADSFWFRRVLPITAK